jgi:multidrug resistance efflux pump
MQTLQQNFATLKRIHTERTDTEAKLQKELEQSILWFDSLRNIHNQWSQQCQAQDECDATQSTAQLEALECEVREYDSTCSSLLTTLRQTLQSCGLKDSTADVEWQTLVQRHNEVRQWEAQVHLVERALAPYHSLPPNIVLAKQHLDAAKHELYQLEERLQQSLAYLQLQ